jgi:hypothetical protein
VYDEIITLTLNPILIKATVSPISGRVFNHQETVELL